MDIMMRRVFIAVSVLLLGFVQSYEGWIIGPFVKPAGNPILTPDSSFICLSSVTGDSVRWQAADVFNPGAIVKDDSVYLLYRCEDNGKAGIGERTSTIGLAASPDGIHFTKYPYPVLFPDSGEFMKYDSPGGCEDPRVVETKGGMYVLMYTSWNRDLARLSVATSHDLCHWKKWGPVFAEAYGGKFLDIWSKSGAIVTAFEDGRLVAAKIAGKYWMYWGDHSIHLAYSADFIDWTPMVDETGKLLDIVSPRPKLYDSEICECGPPAVMTKDGIILLYNGENRFDKDASPDIAKGRYSVGELLFGSVKPWQVLSRTDEPVLQPSLPDELTGQYQGGTTFAEGLVYFKDRWFLYYGAADSRVNVAIAEGNK